MQSASTMQGVPFRQKPRQGQRRVFDELERCGNYLNIQLPTGYGKTFTAAGCYAIKQREGSVNRLLMILPTDAQLTQIEEDSKSDHADFYLAGVDGPLDVVDIRFFGAEAIRRHRTNTAQIFAITVQSLIQPRGDDNVRMLMQSGRWMVVVDEYHHYGIDKAWGRSVRALPASFLLAMSATPTRPDDDSAFGKPLVTVSYRDAKDEQAVKPLRGHAYHYRIDALDPDGTVHSYTTSDLADAAGATPDAVERWKIERKMRWSPKYISPLVSHPLERITEVRLRSGQRVQALFGAMCVSHAELVCGQIHAMYPELAVDWVGTGMNGRSDAANREILKRFCPPKNQDGLREPTLDVLVHVGMAGEGLDSTLVTEVVHLNNAARNNSNDQENGRAARLLLAVDGTVIEGHINFDATSDYAQFVGPAIMDAMDGLDEPRLSESDLEPEPASSDDYTLSPEEPAILIYNMELEHIDSGDPGVQRMARVLHDLQPSGFDIRDFEDRMSPRHDAAVRAVIESFKAMRRVEAEESNGKSVVMQWNDQVNNLLSKVVALVIRTITKDGQRVEKTLAGDIKKRINARKKLSIGEISRDVDVCRLHYRWLRDVEQDILTNGLPIWLW